MTLRTRSSAAKKPSFEEARAALVERLRERQEEIEQAVLTRTLAVSNAPEAHTEPEYLEGMRMAVSTAVSYGIEVVEMGEEQAPAPPPALLAQARLAARYGVGSDTVLRRYSAGYILLSDFLLEEADKAGIRNGQLQRLLRSQGALDRLLAALSEEHARESRRQTATTSEERKAERIERLLAGELIDTSGLEYGFEGHHVGLLAKGPGTQEALRSLAAALDRRLLAVSREDGTTWAWLGGRQPLEMEELQRQAVAELPPECVLAGGEPGEGLPGWRLSHRQAKAARSVAERGADPFVRYADVALLASVLQDDLLVSSLRTLYLEPLERERDGGVVAKETLRAYFTAGQNVSSAAAVLGVRRNTVTSRLRAIEKRLGRSLSTCASELKLALCLKRLAGLPD